jgi:hypothetical protein
MADNDTSIYDTAAAVVMHQDKQSTAQQVRNNMQFAVGTSADQAAEYQHLAKYVGVAPETVQAQPDVVRQQAALKGLNTDTMVNDQPVLAKYLTDPNNTAKSHDDIAPLASVEQAAKNLPGPAPAAQAPSFGDTLTGLPMNFMQGLGGAFNKAATSVNIVAGAFPTIYDKVASLYTGKQTTSASDWWFRKMVDPLTHDAPAFQVAPDAPFASKAAQTLGNLTGMMSQIVLTGSGGTASTAGTTTAEVVGNQMAHGAKSMAFPAMTDAVDTGRKVYQETGDAQQAIRAAQAQYATSTLGGVMPLSAPGGLATRALGGFASGLAAGEVSRQGMNLALPDSMNQPFDIEGALLAGLSGSLLGTVMGPRPEPSYHEAIRQFYTDSTKAEAAEQGMAALQKLGEAATASKTRGRDREAFKEFVRSATENGQLQDVYVDANKFTEVLNQAGVGLPELQRLMPEVAAQLHEAGETKGDIRIPVEDYATHIAGGKLDQAILPHLKVEPDGFTYDQAQQFYQGQHADLKAQAEKILAMKTADDAAQTEAKEIHDRVLDQLNATGRFRPEVNNAYAALTRDFYVTMADRTGSTPAELFAKHPVNIVSEPITSAAALDHVAPADGSFGIGSVKSGGAKAKRSDEAAKLVDRATAPAVETAVEPAGGGARGGFSPESNTVSLLRKADLSTYLHESGHFYLEVMHDIASAADAPQQVRDDFDTLLKSFGIEGDSAEQRLADWTGRTLDQKRAGHEQFARSFEAYLLEGKAPTLELQSLFSRFRSWLVAIYHSLKSLNVELTDEVRGVMDRLVATDDAIRYTEQARGYLPVHVEGTAEEVAAYRAMGKEATDKAVAEMDARSLRDMQWASNAKAKALRELQKQADTQRKAIRDEVTREMEAEPVRQAEAYLKRPNGTDPAPAAEVREWEGRRDAEQSQLQNEVKGKYLASEEGAATKGLKRGQFLAKNKRAIANEAERRLIEWEQQNPRPSRGDPGIDIVAEMFGFDSGAALRKAIKEAGKLKDRIEQETDRRMLERHGDLVDPVSVERAAEAAVHNETRARFIATGLKLLAKSPIPARQLAEAAREAAEAAVAAKRVRDLRPAQHAAAEARANKEAVKLAAKDPQGAVQQQRAALLNNRLFKAASDAVAEVQKGVVFLGKFDKASVRDKIALEYRDQIDAILERFDLRKSTTNTALDARQSLLTFVEQLAGQGLEPQIPEGLLNEARRMHYKDMTVEEFRGLVDAVKSLDHLGRGVQKVIDGQEARDIDELAREAADVMATLPQRGDESNRGLTRIDAAMLKLKSAGRSAQASLLKMEQMMDWLDDRNPNGVLNRIVFRRIADAGVKEADLLAKIKGEIDNLMDQHLADVTRERGKVYEAPGMIDGLTGKPQRFTKKEMLALAGNMGNESNMSKLLTGEGWSETAVWQFLHQNMSKADWDFVAGLGRTLESLWPEKVAMSRRLGNTNPEKIAPRPFDTPHGRYDGWYWPMIYDPARSHDVAMRGARDADSLFENVYARANSDTGRMNTRNANYARPLLLSIDAIPRVIRDEVHDIAYREAIMDADKILRNPTMRKAIVNALSQEHYDQLRPWLQSIANDRKVDMQALKWFDAVAHGARTRATIVGLGYRLSTMLVHGSSAAMESIAEVGPVWFGKGLADFANPRTWAENRDFVFERSGEMRNRMNEVDRDVREHLREIDIRLMDPTSGALARGTDLMKAHAYQGIAMLDMASALPTWMGAYHKGMAPVEKGGKGLSEQDAIYFADKTVRNAHGGTGVKDLAAVQRGPEFFKLFTMFYTFWNHNVNRLMDTGRLATDARTWKDSTLAATVIMRFLIYTLGVQTMHHMLHPQKDDEGETHWLAWAGKEFVSAAFAGVPILRDLSAHYLSGKDYSVTPAAGMVDAVGKSGVDAANALTGKETDPKALKHTVTTAGYLFGLPLGQVSSSAQFIWDVSQGKQDPQNLQDWWNGILHGKIDH